MKARFIMNSGREYVSNSLTDSEQTSLNQLISAGFSKLSYVTLGRDNIVLNPELIESVQFTEED